jgi:hypothetical protein
MLFEMPDQIFTFMGDRLLIYYTGFLINARLTTSGACRLLKRNLALRYGTPLAIDRWSRGVFLQWICWLPRAVHFRRQGEADLRVRP